MTMTRTCNKGCEDWRDYTVRRTRLSEGLVTRVVRTEGTRP